MRFQIASSLALLASVTAVVADDIINVYLPDTDDVGLAGKVIGTVCHEIPSDAFAVPRLPRTYLTVDRLVVVSLLLFWAVLLRLPLLALLLPPPMTTTVAATLRTTPTPSRWAAPPTAWACLTAERM
ncbi:uncharacterized protein BO95DRAFT_134892 [Aspergillus brunneoviolaceus CBS 621.78]|uniref:Uncharacterized protein n=1 Tax=Aspergillus brunneoviolaceus CBS 621.78 TaxID=1450534 RepID=A0ACD1G8V6_9EURO|nr:hypothetical protein BO95DRAFT_134892 [Aspergillus brunneoviolaceus CBS 621.78]RAH45556.1 hypothetical protein BO95DRAFT_134892 [Aspergillus brunneoviolaceus CBS 621.78]